MEIFILIAIWLGLFVGIPALVYGVVILVSKVFKEVFEPMEKMVLWLGISIITIALDIFAYILLQGRLQPIPTTFPSFTRASITALPVIVLVTFVLMFFAFWGLYSQYLVFTKERIKFALLTALILCPWYFVFMYI